MNNKDFSNAISIANYVMDNNFLPEEYSKEFVVAIFDNLIKQLDPYEEILAVFIEDKAEFIERREAGAITNKRIILNNNKQCIPVDQIFKIISAERCNKINYTGLLVEYYDDNSNKEKLIIHLISNNDDAILTDIDNAFKLLKEQNIIKHEFFSKYYNSNELNDPTNNKDLQLLQKSFNGGGRIISLIIISLIILVLIVCAIF